MELDMFGPWRQKSCATIHSRAAPLTPVLFSLPTSLLYCHELGRLSSPDKPLCVLRERHLRRTVNPSSSASVRRRPKAPCVCRPAARRYCRTPRRTVVLFGLRPAPLGSVYHGRRRPARQLAAGNDYFRTLDDQLRPSIIVNGRWAGSSGPALSPCTFLHPLGLVRVFLLLDVFVVCLVVQEKDAGCPSSCAGEQQRS